LNPLQQWLEIGLVILVAWGYGEGERHLGVCAAGGVHPVSEDEAPLAPPHPRVGVAPAGPVVLAPLAVGFDVSAVDGDDLSLHRSGLEEPPEHVVEGFKVGLLAEAVSELGEEAVARCPLPESAGLGGFPVVLKPKGESSVTGDA